MPAGDHEIKCMACGLNCPIEAEGDAANLLI